MTDVTSNAEHKPHRRRTPHKGEYYTYFAIIFVLSLPFSLVGWALAHLTRTSTPVPGPIRSAWSQASTIAPKIFWA